MRPVGEPPVVGAVPPRQRVVLADAARARRAGRTRAELTEQTGIGEALVKGLVRAQLALALRLAAVVLAGLVALPLLFVAAPTLAARRPLGVGLAWLLLGVAAYPFLFVVGWAYLKLTERNERDFTELVERPEK